MRHNTDAHVLVPNVIATTNAEDCNRSDAFDDPRIVAISMSALGHQRTNHPGPKSDFVRYCPKGDLADPPSPGCVKDQVVQARGAVPHWKSALGP